jgi:deazaflavin-dependent oxidoreductase (nitroreductase family)
MTTLQDGASVVGNLTTIGRKSGLKRTVELRFIYHQGCFYASSSRIGGKHWCRNMLQNPAVEISAGGQRLSAVAKQVTEEELRRRILLMRGSPPDLNRRVFEIKPSGNAAGA